MKNKSVSQLVEMLIVNGIPIDFEQENIDPASPLAVTSRVKPTTIPACAGMATAPSKGAPRRLGDFDPATLVRKDA